MRYLQRCAEIGNDHLTPTIGEYQVELLNDLIVRLVTKYTE